MKIGPGYKFKIYKNPFEDIEKDLQIVQRSDQILLNPR